MINELYVYSFILEDAIKSLGIKHLYPKILHCDFYTHQIKTEYPEIDKYYDCRWFVELHTLRDTEARVPCDPQRLKDWIDKETGSVLGFIISYTMVDERDIGHSNLVCINKTLKTIEHCDPWGQVSGFNSYFAGFWLKAVHDLFRSVMPCYTHVYPWDTSPLYWGPQLLQDQKQHRNSCGLWVLWLFGVRIVSPKLTACKAIKVGLKSLQRDQSIYLLNGVRLLKFIAQFGKQLFSKLSIDVTTVDSHVYYSCNGRNKFCPDFDNIKFKAKKLNDPVFLKGKYIEMDDIDVFAKLGLLHRKQYDRIFSFSARIDLQALEHNK